MIYPLTTVDAAIQTRTTQIQRQERYLAYMYYHKNHIPNSFKPETENILVQVHKSSLNL